MSLNPTEHVQEEIRHAASHANETEHVASGGRASRWITSAASTAACLAACAAVTGALATSHLTEATHRRIESNDEWAYYQSKSLKIYLLQTKGEILEALDRKAPADDPGRIAQNELDKKNAKDKAEALEDLSIRQLRAHETFELAATMFHIAIAIVAISVVVRRRSFWYGSMVLGAVGLVLFAVGFIRAPVNEARKKQPAGIGTEQPTTERSGQGSLGKQTAKP